MQIQNLIQGSDAWHQYRAAHLNASDAPAMMGCSPYKTRSQLLHERATGIVPEVDAFTQKLFDDGHKYEALARPLAEEIVGDDLYPVTGSMGELSASFDGLSMDEKVGFEHKSLNDDIRACKCAADLGLHYRVQMEQQLLVSGAEKILFMATKWNEDGVLLEEKHFWYGSEPALRQQVLNGWDQFKLDVANYVAPAVEQVIIAESSLALPALSIRVEGSIALQSNLDKFGGQLQAYVQAIDMAPNDDQGFVNAEAAVKVLEKAQEALEQAEAGALAQTESIDEMRRTVAMYRDLARNTRLALEKVVKTRKDQIRLDIQNDGTRRAAEHITELNERIGKPFMPKVATDFAGVMKGKKTLASLRDAVATELARFKIEANQVAERIRTNLTVHSELAAGHEFLFADLAVLVVKPTDDFTAQVKQRVSDHKAAETQRLEADRARIAEEERIKAEAAARAMVSTAAAPAASTLPPPVIAETARSATVVALPNTAPTLRLGQINERLGLTVTADYLTALGFAPAATDKAAKLYHEQDFPRICDAIAARVSTIGQAQQKAA